MIRAVLLVSLLAGQAAAQTAIRLGEGAQLTSSTAVAPDIYRMPTAPFSLAEQPTERLEGRITRRSWRLTADNAETLTVLRLLRQQLTEDGFEVVFECETASCGGFDFRYGIDVIAPPDMEVDLTDFQFAHLRLDGDQTADIALLVSRAGPVIYVQVTEVRPLADPVTDLPEAVSGLNLGASDWAASLTARGRVVIEGLSFDVGGVQIAEESVGILTDLAGFLKDQPELSFEIVGHSDNVGGLDANITLSKARAAAVRQALVETYGIAPERLSSNGIGYLAPRASNETEEGRALNRRVELVLKAP